MTGPATTGSASTGPTPTGPATTGPATAGRAAPGSAAGGHGAAGEAERIAETALTCPDVPSLTAGPHARIMTYRAGSPLLGVAVHRDRIEVGIVARRVRPLIDTAEDVRRRVRPLAGDLPIDIMIGDVE